MTIPRVVEIRRAGRSSARMNIDTYTYDANDGVTYAGPVAYILNQLDSVEAGFEDIRHDDDEIDTFVNAVRYIIDNPSMLAEHM